jgi:catechol 2,3-dioxygenase-like lactoylglutathione lyase family enzyme
VTATAARGCSPDLTVHLRRARDHVDRHFADDLDLDRLARVAGVSKYHFVRSFEAAYGETPISYLTRRRIERAQDLLRSVNLTVTEIPWVDAMITNISLVTVYCLDQDRAKEFYVDVLGFEARTDITMGEGFRWVTIAHPSQPELEVTLMTPGPPLDEDAAAFVRGQLEKGSMGGLGLAVDDCRRTYEELSAKGVTFLQEPAERPYGVEAVMRDVSGNWLVLVERREFTPADFA